MFGRKNKNNTANFIGLLDKKEFSCVTKRSGTNYTEAVIGRHGVVNIVNGELVLVGDNREIFRDSLSHLEIAMLMSMDGFTVKSMQPGAADTIVVYYKYHTK